MPMLFPSENLITPDLEQLEGLFQADTKPEGLGTEARSFIDCVFLTPSEQEAETVSRLLAPWLIRVHQAVTLDEARAMLPATGAGVLLTEVVFPGGDWEDAYEMLARYYPRLTLVVAATQADEHFWIDVLERGAYDLVSRPFSAEELRRILTNAHAHARQNVFRRKGAAH
jgi:DNA-binding NtrC family response regulator